MKYDPDKLTLQFGDLVIPTYALDPEINKVVKPARDWYHVIHTTKEYTRLSITGEFNVAEVTMKNDCPTLKAILRLKPNTESPFTVELK